MHDMKTDFTKNNLNFTYATYTLQINVAVNSPFNA